VLLLDECSSHKTATTRDVLRRLGYTTIFSAPASYLSAPVEMIFGAMKRKHKDIRSESRGDPVD
jgi:transposase